MNTPKPSIKADYFLDITTLVCPMTFVRTKLLLEKMAVGETCHIRLSGAEPLQNVPRGAVELGHEVLSLDPEAPDPAPDSTDGVFNLLIIKRKR
ncbi:MAG: sulfurtransferase TusA family protein [Rhodospirillaceae bacterium]|nr:sulfurtransferase TusA family protein [Rhodospirillaceae bacterium]